MSNGMTASEALARVVQIEAMLDAVQETAPIAVQSMGGRDALARVSEMTCVGPVPRLGADAWERMSIEYQERRTHGSAQA